VEWTAFRRNVSGTFQDYHTSNTFMYSLPSGEKLDFSEGWTGRGLFDLYILKCKWPLAFREQLGMQAKSFSLSYPKAVSVVSVSGVRDVGRMESVYEFQNDVILTSLCIVFVAVIHYSFASIYETSVLEELQICYIARSCNAPDRCSMG
jgi:hypothetical protein